MGGLLLKDFYVLTKQVKLFILIVILFAMLPGGQWSAFAIMYAAMMPITTLGYDEQSKWGKLAAMMPYTVKQIVLSKYLLGYIAVLAISLLAAAAQFVYGTIKGTGVSDGSLIAIVAMAVVAIFLQAVNLPLMFKMGVEKGRLIFMVLTVGVVLGAIALLDENIQIPNIDTIITVVGVGVVVLNVVSILLSIKLYSNKN